MYVSIDKENFPVILAVFQVKYFLLNSILLSSKRYSSKRRYAVRIVFH